MHKTWIESTFYSKLHLDYMPISLCQSYTYTNPIVNQPTSSCQLQILYPLVYSKHYIHEVSCIILKWPNHSHHPWTDYSYPLGQQCFQRELTVFQPSGSRKAVILVLSPGIGPGCRVIFPPTSWMTWLTTSALLYTSSVPIATWNGYHNNQKQLKKFPNWINFQKGFQNISK